MKISQAILGKRAEREIALERTGCDPFRMLVRPLTGHEEAGVLERARAYAKSKGVAEPKEGDPLYDLALMVETIAAGCVDPDSPKDSREPSFDKGAEQALDHLNREEIAFLYERHQLWQDECSPTVRRVSSDELLATAVKLAEGDSDLPFVRLRPVLRLILVRSLARLLLNSPEGRSQLSSLTAPSGDESKSKAEPPAS